MCDIIIDNFKFLASENNGWVGIATAVGTVGSVFVAMVAMLVSHFKDKKNKKIQSLKEEFKEEKQKLNVLIGIETELSILYDNFSKVHITNVEKSKTTHIVETGIIKPNSNYFIFYDTNCSLLTKIDNKHLLLVIFSLYNLSKVIQDSFVYNLEFLKDFEIRFEKLFMGSLKDIELEMIKLRALKRDDLIQQGNKLLIEKKGLIDALDFNTKCMQDLVVKIVPLKNEFDVLIKSEMQKLENNIDELEKKLAA